MIFKCPSSDSIVVECHCRLELHVPIKCVQSLSHCSDLDKSNMDLSHYSEIISGYGDLLGRYCD